MVSYPRATKKSVLETVELIRCALQIADLFTITQAEVKAEFYNHVFNRNGNNNNGNNNANINPDEEPK
ncbi:MAG: hypothetical protein IPG29_04145 [Sphingobacteriales bacterium]|nr:hypothetical protein [Sphingobacteriales bacterium]